MSQQHVRVITEGLGAWGKGDVFTTSPSHAQSLVEQGMVQLVDQLGNPIVTEAPDTDDESKDQDKRGVTGQLVWPEWLNQRHLNGLTEAGITPAMAYAMSTTALQKARTIGPRTASALKRDLELQWNELTSRESDGVIAKLPRRGIAIG